MVEPESGNQSGLDAPRPRAINNLAAGGLVLVIVFLMLRSCGDASTEGGAGTVPAVASAAGQKEIIAWHRSIVDASARCDAAGEVVAASASEIGDGKAGMLQGYQAARAMRDVCRQVSRDVEAVALPDAFTGEARDLARTAQDNCGLAMFARNQAAEAAMVVFNGDTRPSAVDELSQSVGTASQMAMQCAVELRQAAAKAGLPPAALDKPGDDQRK